MSRLLSSSSFKTFLSSITYKRLSTIQSPLKHFHPEELRIRHTTLLVNQFSTVTPKPENDTGTNVKSDDNTKKVESVTNHLLRMNTETVSAPIPKYNEDFQSNFQTSTSTDEIEELKEEQSSGVVHETGPIETVDERLRRLSMSRAEDFIPSPAAREARNKMKARYKNIEVEYTKKYPHRSNQGFDRNSNFRRYFSTSVPMFLDTAEAITERLQRLSVSDSSTYSFSEKARNKARSPPLSESYIPRNEYNHTRRTSTQQRPLKRLDPNVVSQNYLDDNFMDDESELGVENKNDKTKFRVLENDPNVFGNIAFMDSAKGEGDDHQVDKETTFVGETANNVDGESIFKDEEEDDVRFKPDDRWTQKKLRFKIRELVRENKLKEAITTLTTAHKEGGFQFDVHEMAYLYAIIIAVCAKVGYVRMSFKLFTDMKRRGVKPRGGVYSSLFNACANSPWDSEENINRINRLRETMKEKNIVTNLIHYNAMVKAYGRCGDIQAAFAVVDELVQHEKPTTETYNFLLQACISDVNNGFRHLLATWNKMQSKGIKPDIYTCNLILRVVRECSIQHIGPISENENHSENRKSRTPKKENTALLPWALNKKDANEMMELIILGQNSVTQQNSSKLLNLTDEEALTALAFPKNRLALFGGIRGIISLLDYHKIQPDIKTMMELVQIIEPNEFPDLMNLLHKFQLKPDISFFNLMIKQYQIFGDEKSCLSVLQLLGQFHLLPNIMTWGVLSLGCNTWEAARSMLNEMEEANFIPNPVIMETLLTKACMNFNPYYVLKVMQETKLLEIKPQKEFILKLQNFKDAVQNGLVRKEMGKLVEPPYLALVLEKDPNFQTEFVRFKTKIDGWLKDTEIFIDPQDPWEADYRARYPPRSKHRNIQNMDLKLATQI